MQIGNAEAANLGVDKDLDIQVQLGSKTRGRTRGIQVPELRSRRQWRRMWGLLLLVLLAAGWWSWKLLFLKVHVIWVSTEVQVVTGWEQQAGARELTL